MNTISDDYRARLSHLSLVAVCAILLLGLAQSSFAQTQEDAATTPVDRSKLLQEIDAQLVKLSEDQRNEDAYSLLLAESYLQYASLLTEASAYAEANSAFEQALQIQRSNYGIDAIEQMPTLESLFNNHLSTEDIDSADGNIAQALRIEEENPQIEDRPSVTMQLKLGHYFLDKLQSASPKSEASARYLRYANRYFLAVIEQNKHRRLDQVSLPYGELAMTNHTGNKISRKAEFVYEKDKSIPVTFQNLSAELRGGGSLARPSIRIQAPLDDLVYNQYLNGTIPTASNALKEYFTKAYDESNVEEGLYAAIALGDLNFMVDRTESADRFYAVAWQLAGLMPYGHPIKNTLSQPASLPDFNYAYKPANTQNELQSDITLIEVPMKFNLDEKGRARNVTAVADVERKLLAKAKRELRQMTFRPAFADGVRTSTQDFIHTVSVRAD